MYADSLRLKKGSNLYISIREPHGVVCQPGLVEIIPDPTYFAKS